MFFSDLCESRAVRGIGGNDWSGLTCIVEEPKSCLKTLLDLRETALELQTETRLYIRRVQRETKYGSK